MISPGIRMNTRGFFVDPDAGPYKKEITVGTIHESPAIHHPTVAEK